MREKEQPDQWSQPRPVQRGGEPPPSTVEQPSQSNGKKRRVINREERELPAASNVWFNLGLAALGIAAGSATAAATIVNNPVTQAILWTFAGCITVLGMSYFVVHHEVNRGRRVKRSQVIEDVEES